MTDQIQLTADVDIEAGRGDAKRPRVSILAYGGGVMRVGGWGDLVIDVDGVRAQGSIPLLVDHDNSVDGIAGSGIAEARDGTLLVNGTLASSDAARKLVGLSRDGIELQASVGVSVDESEHVGRGKTINVNGRDIEAGRDGFRLVKRGRLREVSIVAIGADASSAVSIAARRRKDAEMSTDATTNNDLQLDRPADDVNADAKRRDDIWAAAMDFAGKYPDKAGELRELADKAIEAGQDQRDFKLAVIEATHKVAVLPWSGGRGGRATNTTPKTALEASVAARLGCDIEAAYGPGVAEQTDRLRHLTLADVAEQSLRANQIDVPHGQPEMIKAAFSTFSLPGILSNAMNKTLLQQYQESPQTWRAFCAIKSANNFKEHTAYRPGLAEGLSEVPPTGEIKHGTLDEAAFPFKIGTFARMLGISRQDVINDDLNAFSEASTMFARSAARTLTDLVYRTLLDAGTFFSAGNGNTGTTALTIDGVSEAITAMRKQADPKGHPLDIMPRTLVVPPELEEEARSILNSTELRHFFAAVEDATLPVGNPVSGMLQLVVEPRLSSSAFAGNDNNDWYVFGSPGDNPITVAFLQGRQAPIIETEDQDFRMLGIQMRVYHDFGVALGDHRAAFKSAVA